MRLEPVADVGGADEPGAAGDQDVHRTTGFASRAAQVLASSPWCQSGSTIGSGRSETEQRERRARRRAAEHLGRPRHHPAVDAGLVEDLLRELEPRAAPGGGDVVDAVLVALDQQRERLREVAGVGRARDLVGDDDHLGLLGGHPQHRLDEVRAADAEQPRRADDEVARVGDLRRGLAGLLRAAVGRDRARQVGLDVRASPWRRRRRSRWRRRGRSAPWAAAVAATIPAAVSLTRIAPRSSASAPSTSVQAAQLRPRRAAARRSRPRPRRRR